MFKWLFVLMVLSATVSAQSPLNVHIDNTFSNKLTSPATSIVLADGPVWMPAVAATYSAVQHHTSVVVTGVMMLDSTKGFNNGLDAGGRPESNAGQFTNFDLALDYTYTGHAGLLPNVGYARYEFTQLDGFIEEVYTSITFFNVPLTPKLLLAKDWTEDQGGAIHSGTRLELGLVHDVQLGNQPFMLFASATYGDKAFNRMVYSSDASQEGKAKIGSWLAGVAATYILAPKLTLTPSVIYLKRRNEAGVLGKTNEAWKSLGYSDSPASNVELAVAIGYNF